MKKILGLDLGVGSIGWAYIVENEDSSQILGAGVRVVPLSVDEKDEFSSGNAVSKNMKRTQKRGARRNLQRYRLRKHHLRKIFETLGILPDEHLFVAISKTDLWGLRAKAVTDKITLQEFARVLFHLNQKRGFRSNRKANNDQDGGSVSEYKAQIMQNEIALKTEGLTIGQYFHSKLLNEPSFRIKNKVFTRAVYIDEFDKIWKTQAAFYPDILTDELKLEIGDRIIFYQRRLRSQKALVSRCVFEGRSYKDEKGKLMYSGPRSAPNSSPLNQMCKVWESINNLRIRDAKGNNVELSIQDKSKIAEACMVRVGLSQTELFKLLQIPKNEGYQTDALIKAKGIQGNSTFSKISEVLQKHSYNSSDFEYVINLVEVDKVDKSTGDVEKIEIVDESYFESKIFKLWHALYSIEEDSALINYLKNEFNFSDAIIDDFLKIDFTKAGYANKSTKAIRKILPHLIKGFDYSKACSKAGYRHSDYETKSENVARELLDQIELLPKGALRQPVVERILNQLINLVNAIIRDNRYGRPDEVRIELARELKQNINQRSNTFKRNNIRERENKKIVERLSSEYGFKKVTRSLIEKYRLFEETDGISLYSGKRLELAQCLIGEDVDIDHIVPKSLLFDDSFQNRVLCEGWINKKKGKMTAYDFMKEQPIEGLQPFESYLEMIRKLKEKKEGLSSLKYDRLTTNAEGIPDNFIDRQLRQTAFISRKAGEILKQCIREVSFTSGMVTDFFREKWGWNDVLKNLNWEQYTAMGLTSVDKFNNRSIEGWSKRDDHRHHAIDALVIACTKQKYIQALNNLSQLNGAIKSMSLPTIDKMVSAKPFTTAEVERVIGQIFISIKKGKRLASKSFNKITGETKLIPRGPLSEETVYGKIKIRETREVPLNANFHPEWQIADKKLKKLVKDRLAQHNNVPKEAFKKMLFSDKEDLQPVKKVPIWHFVEEYVVKYKVESLKEKDLPFIVDQKVRERIAARLRENNGNEKEAFKNIETNPVYLDDDRKFPIKSVRMRTGLSKVEAIHVNADGTPVDFVKPGNNHVFVLYKSKDDQLSFDVISFMEAFERKRLGFSTVEADAEKELIVYQTFEANQNFILNITQEELDKFIKQKNYKEIAKQVYRVQKFTKKGSGSMDIWFRQQFQTKLLDSNEAKLVGFYKNYTGVSSIFDAHLLPCKISLLGDISF